MIPTLLRRCVYMWIIIMLHGTTLWSGMQKNANNKGQKRKLYMDSSWRKFFQTNLSRLLRTLNSHSPLNSVNDYASRNSNCWKRDKGYSHSDIVALLSDVYQS